MAITYLPVSAPVTRFVLDILSPELTVYRRQFQRGDISHLAIKRSGSTGQGADKIEHYKIHAVDNGGKKVTLAEDIDGEDVATHFRDFLAQRIGVATEG